jgi:hypothetical protein
MSHTRQVAQALGKVARNSVKQLGPRKPSDREVAEKTFSVIKRTIESNDRWCQSESRDVLTFRDRAEVFWRLTVTNKHARLHLVLSCDGNRSNRSWVSQPLLVGGLAQVDSDRIAFRMNVEWSYFSQWRRSVMRDRPETRSRFASS